MKFGRDFDAVLNSNIQWNICIDMHIWTETQNRKLQLLHILNNKWNAIWTKKQIELCVPNYGLLKYHPIAYRMQIHFTFEMSMRIRFTFWHTWVRNPANPRLKVRIFPKQRRPRTKLPKIRCQWFLWRAIEQISLFSVQYARKFFIKFSSYRQFFLFSK